MRGRGQNWPCWESAVRWKRQTLHAVMLAKFVYGLVRVASVQGQLASVDAFQVWGLRQSLNKHGTCMLSGRPRISG